MKIKILNFLFFILLFTAVFFNFTSCFNEKQSPIYAHEWIMKNQDFAGNQYVHQIFFKANHVVTIQVYYEGSENALVWTGKYKLSGKKIVFDIENCAQLQNGKLSNRVTKTSIIKYFSGDFFYVLSEKIYSEDELSDELANETPVKTWRMELIRPQNIFYGKNLDFMGQKMETWVRVEE
ncbi:MAG: hypothetical protein ACTTHG_03775 [Treponemataceae bacterium]